MVDFKKLDGYDKATLLDMAYRDITQLANILLQRYNIGLVQTGETDWKAEFYDKQGWYSSLDISLYSNCKGFTYCVGNCHFGHSRRALTGELANDQRIYRTISNLLYWPEGV